VEPLFLCFWTRTGEWEFVVHGANTSTKTQRHVHVRRIRKRKGEYSWNIDGTRHDKREFPESEGDIKRAKEIAGARLKMDPNIFTFVTAFGPDDHVHVISPEPRFAIYSLLRPLRTGMLLTSDDWAIIMSVPEDDPGT
jgi:hypothetical protein